MTQLSGEREKREERRRGDEGRKRKRGEDCRKEEQILGDELRG